MEKTSPRMVLGGKGFIQVSPMKDSTKLYKDQNYTELRKQLDIFGYLLIRELIDHEKVCFFVSFNYFLKRKIKN